MDKTLRDSLTKRAQALGFDSAQAFIRFWARVETEGRKVHYGEDDWGEPPAHVVKR